MALNNTWKSISYKECKPYNIPSKKELYKNYNITDDGWKESHNKWCIGCHNTY